MLTADLRVAAELLGSATDVTLLGHVNPDADALGSALAIGLALRRRGATVRVSFGAPAEPPEALRALDPIGLLVPADDVPAAPELLVVLDCSSVDRTTGSAAEVVDRVREMLRDPVPLVTS